MPKLGRVNLSPTGCLFQRDIEILFREFYPWPRLTSRLMAGGRGDPSREENGDDDGIRTGRKREWRLRYRDAVLRAVNAVGTDYRFAAPL